MSIGKVSTGNSTITPLSGGATFEGVYDGTLEMGQVQVLIFSDVASASGGIQFVWSTDGVNDDFTQDVFSYPAGTVGQVFQSPSLGNFFRVRYINGAGAQATFRMQTIFRDFPPSLLFQRFNATFSGTEQALSSRARIMGILGQTDTSNSSTATLGIGATFTGVAKEVRDFCSIVLSIKSDVSSASLGVAIEWSEDGTNWDITETFTYVATAGIEQTFMPRARFYRIRYTNGGTGQGHFRLNSTIRPFAVQPAPSAIYIGSIRYPVLQAAIAATASGATTILAADTLRRIRVVALNFAVASAVTVGWLSAANVLVDQQSFSATGGMDVNRMPYGFFCETNVNETLRINLGGAAVVNGSLNYILR